MAPVPPDLNYPPGSVALMYRAGDTFIVRIAHVQVSGETVRLEPIGPQYFRPPPGSPIYRISFAVGDFDGDGRNEFVFLDRERNAAHIFKAPSGVPEARATLSHYERWSLPPETTSLLALVPSPGLATGR